ncbi:MAG: hypothetical protein GTN36_05525 [Candidatus Aenigmarchaeota archaeon]|nr:hypothetical protein [Candidatus Aenigmarchaeota archaeon]
MKLSDRLKNLDVKLEEIRDLLLEETIKNKEGRKKIDKIYPWYLAISKLTIVLVTLGSLYGVYSKILSPKPPKNINVIK